MTKVTRLDGTQVTECKNATVVFEKFHTSLQNDAHIKFVVGKELEATCWDNIMLIAEADSEDHYDQFIAWDNKAPKSKIYFLGHFNSGAVK